MHNLQMHRDNEWARYRFDGNSADDPDPNTNHSRRDLTDMIETKRPARVAIALMMTAAALSACSSGDKSKGGAANQPGQGTPEVGFVVVQPTSAASITELAGRTAAYESSDVRPQVSGDRPFRRLFTEGSLVTKGQPLYQIDPASPTSRSRPIRRVANLASAQGQCLEATAHPQADRYKPLAAIAGGVSKQDYTNAVATARQAAASVQQNRRRARYRASSTSTSRPSPRRSPAGSAARCSPSARSSRRAQTDPLAQIQRLDPIYVDIQQSAGDLLALRRSTRDGRFGVTPTKAVVRLKLARRQRLWPDRQRSSSTEALVDQTTGTVTLRARFPNQQGILLFPGMFVTALRSRRRSTTTPFSLPQQGGQRATRKGNATA